MGVEAAQVVIKIQIKEGNISTKTQSQGGDEIPGQEDRRKSNT